MSRVFLDILIVLVAAKLAAEVADRIKVPPVVGEIIAGIVIGPSALGLVGAKSGGSAATVSSTEILHTLGEIGVILLLLEVGMQMDLRELRAVGRASMSVATIGVVIPFATGFVIAELFDLTTNQALFTSAALTATSVGITARVFGDLRALATIEARTVLGAAVADDVIGLVILTIVVRIVTGSGTVTLLSVGKVVAVAVLFLVGTTAVGAVATPRLFAGIDRYARSSGTLFALALAFTLGIAQLATAAKLAPIVGAFVAGLSLGRSHVSQRVQRELTPVGHLFIPVFFLQIGIDTNVKQFAKPAVLGLAGALLVVAILGKIIAGVGAVGSPGNKLLIGLGMIPRGEVGLIFASIGLREGILGQNSYAAILLMVLVTTLITPPLLTLQLNRMLRRRTIDGQDDVADVAEPIGGWLSRRQEPNGTTVLGLVARPPVRELLPIAVDAAIRVETADPAPELIEWIGDGLRSNDATTLHWDAESTRALLRLLEEGTVRSWRFLETTGLLERSLPELTESVRRRRFDPALLDPAGVLRWPLLHRMRRLLDGTARDRPTDRAAIGVAQNVLHPDRLLLAALLIDATADEPVPDRTARALLERLTLDPADRRGIAALVSDQQLLRAAAVRRDGLREDSVLRIAAHLGDQEQARELYVLSVALNSLESWEASMLDDLHRLVMLGLEDPTLKDAGTGTILERTRDRAAALVADHRHLVDRISAAPISYLLAEEPTAVARHVTLIEPVPTRGRFRVGVHAERADVHDVVWRVEVGGRDQLGLLALVTGVLEEARLDVIDAVIATWGDGGALQAFRVRTDAVGLVPDAEALTRALSDAQQRDLIGPPVADAVVEFDDSASPWHTLAEVRATDRRGLLHALAVAFAAAGADVHAARITTEEAMALDRFDLTDRDGRKLDDDTKGAIRTALLHGVVARPFTRRLPWRGNRVGTIRKQSGDTGEISAP